MRRAGPQLALSFLLVALPAALGATDREEPLLTPAQVQSLDRENAMWHQMKVDRDVEENITALRATGFAATEVEGFRAKLEPVWTVKVDRNFGWMHEEQVEKIKAVDRDYIARIRAQRLRRTAGIQLPGYPPETMSALNDAWHRAVLRVLDYDEIAEFRLMNNTSARKINGWLEGVEVTADERRTLCEWQGSFDAGRRAATNIIPTPLQQEDELDHWRRVRELLGDARAVVVLDRAVPRFEKMHRALERSAGASPAAAMDAWWLRRRLEIENARSTQGGSRRADELRGRFAALFGAEALARYYVEEDGRWLRPPPALAPAFAKRTR